MHNNRNLSGNDYLTQSNQIINIISNFTTILRNTEMHTYNLVNNPRFNMSNNIPTFPSPIITRPRNIFSTTVPAVPPSEPFQSNTLLSEMFNNLTPVRVHPTVSQIRNATSMIPFQNIENPMNTRCPIRHEDFQDTDIVMQIRHCRHNFNSVALNRWFENAVRCPVCRYDIREYDPDNENSNEDVENQEPEPYSVINNVNEETEENTQPEPEIEFRNTDYNSQSYNDENDLSNNRITVNAVFTRNVENIRNNIISQITNVIENIITTDLSNNNGIISIEYQIDDNDET